MFVLSIGQKLTLVFWCVWYLSVGTLYKLLQPVVDSSNLMKNWYNYFLGFILRAPHVFAINSQSYTQIHLSLRLRIPDIFLISERSFISHMCSEILIFNLIIYLFWNNNFSADRIQFLNFQILYHVLRLKKKENVWIFSNLNRFVLISRVTKTAFPWNFPIVSALLKSHLAANKRRTRGLNSR